MAVELLEKGQAADVEALQLAVVVVGAPRPDLAPGAGQGLQVGEALDPAKGGDVVGADVDGFDGCSLVAGYLAVSVRVEVLQAISLEIIVGELHRRVFGLYLQGLHPFELVPADRQAFRRRLGEHAALVVVHRDREASAEGHGRYDEPE